MTAFLRVVAVCSAAVERVVLLHPHGAKAHSVFQKTAAVFNRNRTDAEVVVEESSWGSLFDALVSNLSCYQRRNDADPCESYVASDVGVVTIGNTWAADLYDKGVLTSLQSNLDDWRRRRRRGDVTRDFVRNIDMDYMFPKDKTDPNLAGSNEWYALPFDVGTRVMFYRPDLYRMWLNETRPPDTLEDVHANGKAVVLAMEADERVSLWKVSNAEDTLWVPRIAGVIVYENEECTLRVPVVGYRCNTVHDAGVPCSLPQALSAACNGSRCPANAASVGFVLSQDTVVRCVTVTSVDGRGFGAGRTTVTIPIGNGTRPRLNDGRLSDGRIGIVLEASDDAAVVVEVEAGGTAASAGLRVGMSVATSITSVQLRLAAAQQSVVLEVNVPGGLSLHRYRAVGTRSGWRHVDKESGTNRVMNSRTWGFPLESAGGASSVMQSFMGYLFGHGSEYVAAGGQCPYTTEPFRTALRHYTNTYLQREENRLNPKPNMSELSGGRWWSTSGYFARGKAVHIVGATWLTGALLAGGWGSGTLQPEQLGVAPQPSGPVGRFGFLGGSGWSIPSYVTEAKRRVAWDFMELLCDPDREFLPEAVFQAGLIPAYESVLVRSQTQGVCGDVCRTVITGLPFAVPLHYPHRGFFKMARLEANNTVEWMVQEVMQGMSIEEATETARGWFDYLTTIDNVGTAPPESGDRVVVWILVGMAGCLAAVCGLVSVLLFLRATKEQRRVHSMVKASAIAAEMARAVGSLAFESEAIHHLENLDKPDEVQTALQGILVNMRAFVKYIPQNVVMGVRSTSVCRLHEDEDGRQRSENTVVAGSPLTPEESPLSGRRPKSFRDDSDSGVSSREDSQILPSGAAVLRRVLETRWSPVTCCLARRRPPQQGDSPSCRSGEVDVQNVFLAHVVAAMQADKAVVHRMSEDCVVGTWGTVSQVRGRNRVCRVALQCASLQNVHCGVMIERCVCASVGTAQQQFYAVLGPTLDRVDQLARIASAFQAPALIQGGLASDMVPFFRMAPFARVRVRDGAIIKCSMLVQDREHNNIEWMYQLEMHSRSHEHDTGIAEVTGMLFLKKNPCAARDLARELVAMDHIDKFMAAAVLDLLSHADNKIAHDPICVYDSFPFQPLSERRHDIKGYLE